MPAITLDMLTTAIQKSIYRKNVKREEAQRVAEHILNFFGYSNRIIDNVLEPEDRDVFYMMEDTGILTTEREETTLFDGREWRIHYWMFQNDNILKILNTPEEKGEVVEENVYDEIFRDQRLLEDIYARRLRE